MKYCIEIAEKIEKKLIKLPKRDRERVIEAIDALAENLRPASCKKLQGNQKPQLYRVRAGNYRVIYSIEDEILLILIIEFGHRKDVYKSM